MGKFSNAIECNRMQPAETEPRSGFTLIELLSVMAVMILISTVVVTSGFGLRRSAAYSSSISIPSSVMEYARQRACMDGRKTAVLFGPNGGTANDTDETAAFIFQAVGTVSEVKSDYITDMFSDIAAFNTGFNLLTAFDFRTGAKFIVGSVEKKDGKGGGQVAFDSRTGGDATADDKYNTYYFPYVRIVRSSTDPSKQKVAITGNWQSGDTYGFEIADRQVLPKNFEYTMKTGGHKPKGDSSSFWFVFNPDGTTDGSGSAAITVKETIGTKKFRQDITFN